MDLSGRYRKRRYQRLLYRSGVAGGFLVVAALMVWGFFWIPYFRIRTVIIEGVVEESQLRSAIDVQLAGFGRFFLPRDNFFLVSSVTLAEFIRSHDWGIATVEKKFPQAIQITFPQRTPYAIFCGNDTLCYYMSRSGLLFSEAPQFSNAPLPVMMGSSPVLLDREPIGQYIANASGADWLATLIEQLDAQGIKSKIVEIQNTDSKTLPLAIREVKVFTDGDWYVFANSEIPARKLVNDIMLLLDQAIKKNQGRLEYIDVRFPNKAFYKLR